MQSVDYVINVGASEHMQGIITFVAYFLIKKSTWQFLRMNIDKRNNIP